MSFRTEDQVRDESKLILGFDEIEKDIKQGTGQITTFNQLGFKGIIDKPDGWYLPKNINDVAIILETKSEKEDINKKKYIDELFKNIEIISKKYNKTIGILYNGIETKVYKNKIKIDTSTILQNKIFYLNLYKNHYIDKNRIYTLTKKINENLHFKFGIKNLYHRMIFTAAALVSERYGADLNGIKNRGYEVFRNVIRDTIQKSLEDSKKQNMKLDILMEVYIDIKMNIVENKEAINDFIDCVIEISDSVNSDNWNGEDVMGIFFNEFNRYKKKSESGQVFTPDHITSLMYRILEVNANDKILDAACGSGAFLVKSMSNMIKEVGGINTKEAKKIKEHSLFGIEFDREIFALACANMMIHKDGKTNLEQLDSRDKEASEWIKSKGITKVLMNPPFERKYGCKKIVENVLNSVPSGIKCAFIMPEKKMEKDKMGKLLEKHHLEAIIKLPEKLFDAGVTTSIYVFETGKKQVGEIYGCYIEEDGLERVKNQGRQDIKDKWMELENYWVESIRKRNDTKYGTSQWIDPKKFLSYQKPKAEFVLHEEDFVKTMMNYLMFKNKIDVKEFSDKLINKTLYNSEILKEDNNIIIRIKDAEDNEN
ncbi:N-6 DNA methylase [Aliarcobacter butzleri]|uniref:site-specific DNA-methyltransferase (adenine-specific) n=1 Tax=Aliarcobacter butzleri TaxID=28197 RepID=A0AAW7QBN4_9BACT|nr:N-6 DNA methylase [Aliarcobacter butzleri]MDN5106966.1 N-6 DNA methylase [Aliarcobacter butzleri]MDN5123818.1 N-6 DNA methylase [Aliarcobacter butzleri]